MTKNLFAIPVIFTLIFYGCQSHDHDDNKTETPGNAVTFWGSATELFMEYPALVVGEETRFAVHLTWLSNYKPVTEGVLALEFISTNGDRISTTDSKPSSPGIYRPTVTFTKAGTYELTMVLKGGDGDTLHVSNMVVYASASAVPQMQEESGEPLITFLKEQQWQMEFKTEPVTEQMVSGSIHAAAEIVPMLGGEAIVSAPFTGTIPADHGGRLPIPGSNVIKGSRLAVMIPSSEPPGGQEDFASRYTHAESELAVAEKEYLRAKKLYATQSISEKEYMDIEGVYRRAVITLKSLARNVVSRKDSATPWMSESFQLKAPITGTVTEVHLIPGRQVLAGDPLFRIINTKHVWVRANVAVPEIGKLNTPDRAWLDLTGIEETFEIHQRNGKLISIGSAVEEKTRTIPVIFQVQNPKGVFRIGMVGELHIATGKAHRALVVPETALLEDEGRYSVYVHVEGEAFAKRDVKLGARETGRVEILSGLKKGERVVTVGAYQVRLASMSSQVPEHGHTH